MTVANPDTGTTNEPQDPGVDPGQEPTQPAGGEPSQEPKTIMDGGGEAIQTPQDWPEDWRTRMAGDPSEYESEEDYEKEVKRLQERFKSPKDIFKSYREMEKFAKSRKPDIPKPGPNASEEEIEKYRTEKGIPNSPQDYNLEFEDGFTLGEDYQKAAEEILEFAHKHNFDQEDTKKIVREWAERNMAQEKEVAKADEELRVNTLSQLKQEWGGEFEGNINAVNAVFQNAPKEMMARLLTAKDPETGLSVGNDPETVKWLVDLGKTINPTATVVPSNTNDGASVNDEIGKIESMMWSSDPAERKRYRQDDALQKRYRDLLAWRENQKG